MRHQMNEKYLLPTELWHVITQDMPLNAVISLRLVCKHFYNPLTRLIQAHIAEATSLAAVYNSERAINAAYTLFQLKNGQVIGVAPNAWIIGFHKDRNNVPTHLTIPPVKNLITSPREVHAYTIDGRHYRSYTIPDSMIAGRFDQTYNSHGECKFNVDCADYSISLGIKGELTIGRKTLVYDIENVISYDYSDHNKTFTFLLRPHLGGMYCRDLSGDDPVVSQCMSNLQLIKLTYNTDNKTNLFEADIGFRYWKKIGGDGLLVQKNKLRNVSICPMNRRFEITYSQIDAIKSVACSFRAPGSSSENLALNSRGVEYFVLGDNGKLYYHNSKDSFKFIVQIEAIDKILYMYPASTLIALSKSGVLYQITRAAPNNQKIYTTVNKIGNNIKSLITDSGYAKSNAYCVVVSKDNSMQLLTAYLDKETNQKLQNSHFHSHTSSISANTIKRFGLFNEHFRKEYQIKLFDVYATNTPKQPAQMSVENAPEKDFETAYMNISDKLVFKTPDCQDLPAIREDFAFLFYHTLPGVLERIQPGTQHNVSWLSIGQQFAESYKNNTPLNIEKVEQELLALMNSPTESNTPGALISFIGPLFRLEKEAAQNDLCRSSAQAMQT